MKQLKLTFLLTLLMSIVCIQASAHDIEEKNADGVTIYYEWTNNKTELAVSYRGSFYISYSNEYTGNIAIPESITYSGMTYSVTSIGSAAFQNCTGLTSITIPNSVTSIGSAAFQNCSGLTSIEIPNSVTSIGIGAFSRCSGLTSVRIEDGDQTLSISGGSSYGAFLNCNALTTLYIGRNINSLNDIFPFYGTNISDVTIGDKVTSIGGSGFYGRSDPSSIVVSNGNAVYDSRDNCNAIIRTQDNTLIAGCKNTTIPNSVTSIGEGAFYGCEGLTFIEIPNSVTSIGDYAFYKCTGLTSASLSDNIISIGNAAINNSTKLLVNKGTKTLLTLWNYYQNSNIKKYMTRKEKTSCYLHHLL